MTDMHSSYLIYLGLYFLLMYITRFSEKRIELYNGYLFYMELNILKWAGGHF